MREEMPRGSVRGKLSTPPSLPRLFSCVEEQSQGWGWSPQREGGKVGQKVRKEENREETKRQKGVSCSKGRIGYIHWPKAME